MRVLLGADFLEAVVDGLAARDWSRTYLRELISTEGSGVVSGVEEHFAALKMMSALPLGDIAVPTRFCIPSDFDE